MIYNSRNFSILLNGSIKVDSVQIYNSRNFSILLNTLKEVCALQIYNSRNFSILLNCHNYMFSLLYLQQ